MTGVTKFSGSQNRSIQLVIFDWSGVISDDRLPVYRANSIIVENFGKTMPTFQKWMNGGAKQAHVEFFRDLGINKDAGTLHNLYAMTYVQVKSREGIKPFAYSDAKQSLETLSGKVKLVVISAHPERALIEEAEEYGVAKYFTDIIGSVRDKSDCIFRVAHNTQSRLRRSEAVYVGDMTYDIDSARNGEVLAAAIATGYSNRKALEEKNPDFLFDSLTEFTAAILLRR